MLDREPLSTYLDAIAGYRVYTAHNANVDAIASASDVAPNLEAPDGQETTSPIDSPLQLSRGIAAAMDRGDGDLVAITDEFGQWLEANLEPADSKLGGQGGLMADLLGVLGANPVLYTYLLTETQRSMFADPDVIEFPVVEDDELVFRPLAEVTNADQTKINWIFEFEQGEQFHDVTAASDSRFIAAARPDRVNLDTGLQHHVGELADGIECALLSGYHSLKEEYEDGTTYEDCIETGREFIQELRADRDLPVQVEYGVTHKEGLRQAIAERILPEVDALGVDSRELHLLVDDLGLEEVQGREGIAGTYEQCQAVREALGIDCVKVHRTHYFLAATSGDYCPSDAIRQGWDFASIVAAAKATVGTIDEPGDLTVGLDVDYSDAGLDAMEELADHLDAEVEDDAVTTEHAIGHPNRVVPDPIGTVGLGDSVAIANFSVEQALASRTEPSVSH